MRIAAIILAAGKSSRFEGGNKLLADVRGQPMLAYALKAARAAGLDDVLVVTGNQAEEVGAIAREGGAETVHNPDFAEGMSSSIRAGISAVPEDVEAVFLMLGDMPLVQAETLIALVKAAQNQLEKHAFIPVFAGEKGNPVLVKRALFAPLKQLSGDQGARKMLLAMPDIVMDIAVEDAGILADFDTRESLAQ